MVSNKLIIITGPSGIGKTYLANILRKIIPTLHELKLLTTRPSRSKNGKEADRISVTNEEFKARETAGEFLVHGKFHGNWYGYPKHEIMYTSGPLVTNTWPALLPQFASLPRVIIVGLTTESSNLTLLKKRMLNRGDSEKQVIERLEIVREDIKTLEQHRDFVNSKGKIFTIAEDRDLAEQVVPWILKQL